MSNHLQEEGEFPNFVTDETGSVMVEFVIVAPLLLTIMLMEFFFIDFNRFQINAQVHASTIAWKRVGEASNTGADDSSFGIVAPAGLPAGVSAFLNTVGGAVNLRIIQAAAGPARALVDNAGIGSGQAGIIHAANNAAGHTMVPLGVNGNSLAHVDMRSGAQELGAPTSDLTYRNTTFIQPLVNLIHSGTWIGKDGAATSGNVVLQDYFLAVPASGTSMNDPGSVFWGNKEKRARYVDRYTILRSPIFFAGAVGQTVISGGILSLAEIPVFIEDSYGDGLASVGLDLSGYSSAIDGIGALFTGGSALFEQAQPMRKVDKIVNTSDHDEDGNFPYHGYSIEDKNLISPADDSEKADQFQ